MAESNLNLNETEAGKEIEADLQKAKEIHKQEIKDLEKEKANKGLWGGQQQRQGSMGMGFGAAQKPTDAFGSFGNGAPSSGDDLLL